MYFDGFVVPVPGAKRDKNIADARHAAEVFRDHGATRVVECWRDNVPEGAVTSFPSAVKLEEGEVACFSWIGYPDKETRDRCHKARESDPRYQGHDPDECAFDGKRLIFGGFSVIVGQ